MSKIRKILLIVAPVVVVGVILVLILANMQDKDSPVQSKRGRKSNESGIVTETTPTPDNDDSKYHVGDIVVLGRYEQDGNDDNGLEEIEWVVLETKGDELFVISRFALDCVPFNTSHGEAKWENSYVRNWLNDSFYNQAFNDKEKSTISETTVKNADYYIGFDSNGTMLASNKEDKFEVVKAHTSGGADTKDRLFLLNVDEANDLFESNKKRIAVYTKYARERFLQNCIRLAKESGYIDEKMIREKYEMQEEEFGYGYCSWLLRSSGIEQSDCAIVYVSGEDFFSENAESTLVAVRPAMWISVSDD